MKKLSNWLVPLLLIGLTSYSYAQSTLSIPQIMQGEKFVGFLPEDAEWSADSKKIYFNWNPDMEMIRSDYEVDIQGNIKKLTDAEVKNRIENGNYNSDRSKMVYSKNGDLYLYDVQSKKVLQITSTTSYERFESFSSDGKHVIFLSDNNLYSWNMNSGALAQLTDFRSGSESGEKELNEQEQWLEEDQLDMFEILAERKKTSEMNEERSDARKPDRPLTIYQGKKRLQRIQISPNLNFVTYLLRNNAEDKRTEVPDFVTQSGYVQSSSARAKVGSPQDTYEMGIYDRQRDTTYMVDTKQIEGIYDKPVFKKEYADGDFDPKYEKPREVTFSEPIFSEDGKLVLVIRSQDNKDRWIMQLNPESAELTLIDRQHDDAWVGGPGISGWNMSSGNIGWIDNETVWFQSEETGFSHLYSYDLNKKKKKPLTSGEFEIRDAKLSHDKKTFFVQSNRESPHIQHFYHLPAKGGKMKQITTGVGRFDVTVSPDEKKLLVRHSKSNEPWELYVMDNKAGAEMKKLTSSTTDEFKNYSWRTPEIIKFKASDGVEVPARLYKPENPNGAGVIFVHGAGYLQNVHTWWSSYYREFMFHNFLVDNGYTVLDIDYRGSDGYGRDWRTAIYRHMGGKDLSDQIDGAKYLVAAHGLDANRLGMYGGSYGGFITIMAMLTSPNTFKAGAALRSVTDWAHYNHGYTSNILNTPVEDSIAFKRSSPIYFAEGLKGRLVMLHGMVDDNVQFQDVVRLSQRFIELGKTNWDLAVFPMEPHGFKEASSWADEYRRIYELLEQELK